MSLAAPLRGLSGSDDTSPLQRGGCLNPKAVCGEAASTGFWISCRQVENGAEKPEWVEPRAAAVSDEIMAAAMEEMQTKLFKLDVDNARLRVELVGAMLLPVSLCAGKQSTKVPPP